MSESVSVSTFLQGCFSARTHFCKARFLQGHFPFLQNENVLVVAGFLKQELPMNSRGAVKVDCLPILAFCGTGWKG
jgi:hypothetical protein